MSPTVCIQWPNLGPYHVARLGVTRELFEQRGWQLVALETTSASHTYAWGRHAADAVPREIVFPDRSLDVLRPLEIHRRVTATLDRLRPDAVAINSYSLPDARACLAWCLRRRRPAVLMTDSKADDVERSAGREAIKRTLVAPCRAAVVAGSPQEAYVAQLGVEPEAIWKGYDVVDNDHFRRAAEAIRREPAAARSLAGLTDGSPYFLASSRFIERKNLPFLLDAYARYREQTSVPWRLVLLGDGALRAPLEQQIERDRIDGVTLPGFVPPAELPAYYGLAGAFVHTARTEQWGLVINEAMASSLPVIVSRTTGCVRDLVRDGVNGLTFAPDDPAALVRHLLRIERDAALRNAMALAAREAIADWPLERFGRSMLAAVEHALGRPLPSRWQAARASLILALIRYTARSVDSYHAVEA